MTAAIGQRLKVERVRLGLSQTAFAGLAEASKRAQISWENGQSYPHAAALAAFHVAGADTHYIITGEREAAPDPADPYKLPATAFMRPGLTDAARAVLALIPPAERIDLLLDLLVEARAG